MRVVTYGTFDLFHEGHRRLLERARALGTHLTVGVTSESYDRSRGKLNVSESLIERIRNVERSGLADHILVEEYEGQKIHDIQRLEIDIFAIGSDWLGHFDYLRPHCDVVYLDRTRGVSSTQLRSASQGVMSIGIVGAGRIARRFVRESRYVSGVNVEAVHSRRHESAASFATEFELKHAFEHLDDLIASVDSVYIASPHGCHYEQAKKAILSRKHVLCEKPLTLTADESRDLYRTAENMGVVLLEAIKTAYAPGFQRLAAIALSGRIGTIRGVDATFTRLISDGREYEAPDGGSISELASYPLLAIVKLLGTEVRAVSARSVLSPSGDVDIFSRIDIDFDGALATATTGIGVKSDGSLTIMGTTGYIHVPAPWWLTSYFEIRTEDANQIEKHVHQFEGDGLRYEIAEFARLVRNPGTASFNLSATESITITEIIESARRSMHRMMSPREPG